MSTDIDKNIKNEYTLPIASNLLMLSNQIETNDKNAIEALNIIQPSPYSEKLKYNSFFHIYYLYIGKTLCFYYPFQKIQSDMPLPNPPFSVGPQYAIFTCFFSFIIIAFPVVLWFIYSYFLNVAIKIYYTSLFIILITSYLGTFLVNPGIMFQNVHYEKNDDMDYCNECNQYYPKSKKVRHCQICEVCTDHRDHHCGVIGKCISRGNIIWFYTMFVSSMLSMGSIYIVIIVFLYNTFSQQETTH